MDSNPNFSRSTQICTNGNDCSYRKRGLCTFTHPDEIQELNTKIQCKYFNKCYKKGCAFKHPPNCLKYLNCQDSECSFVHHTVDCGYGVKCWSKNCAYRHAHTNITNEKYFPQNR